jgi:hypothetical protein
MEIIIDGSMDIDNSRILISPLYVEPPYTGPICVSGGGVDGTYAFDSFITYSGYTRPSYISVNGLVSLAPFAKYGSGYLFRNRTGDQEEIYYSTTSPIPEYPYLENPNSWVYFSSEEPTGFPITITKGSC